MRYVAELVCSVCGARYPADRPMNLCERDGRPVQVRIDLERLQAERGRDGFWDPNRPSLWRFGGLLPLDLQDEADRRSIVSLGEGHTPCLPYPHPLAERIGCRIEVKDEGVPWPGFGANPTLSFKDRGMAMTASMARALGLNRLVAPTQGNAGDSLARYAVAAGIEALIVLSPETDRPVLGNVTALAALHPERVRYELVPGTIVDCGAKVVNEHVPNGWFNVATFQEPGWRTEGKKTLGLELAEPSGDRLQERRWRAPDVIVYPTGGGTGIVGMAKAFDELEALGLIGPERPRFVSVQSSATAPLARAFEAGRPEPEPAPPGQTIATGLNVARNVGHINVLKVLRDTGGAALAVNDARIETALRAEWRERRFAWSPEGAATVAVLEELADRRLIGPGDRVVLVNTAAAEKYLPTIRGAFLEPRFLEPHARA